MPYAIHRPGLAAAPATGIQAIHIIPAVTDNASLLLAILNASFKAALPPLEVTISAAADASAAAESTANAENDPKNKLKETRLVATL